MCVCLGRLDSDIEAKLAVRLEAGIKAWTTALLGLDEEQDVAMDTEEQKLASGGHKLGGEPKIMRTVHELRMQVCDALPIGDGTRAMFITLTRLFGQNGEIILHPAVEEARERMLKELFAWEAVILNLPRIKHTRYQVIGPLL